MTDPVDVDTFAGPGGWDRALVALGRKVVGFELDSHACATRAAAGLLTVRADVAAYPLEHVKARGFIGSPPCQSFSRAGRQGGKTDGARLRQHLVSFTGKWTDPDDEPWADARSALVLQPLRWIAELEPEWVALEQVPMVAPIWQAMTVALSALGYRCVVGQVNAADFGVPQVRLRAVLLARRDRCPSLPTPTHTKTGSATRAKWVTMASALGWPESGEGWREERRNDQSQSGEGDPWWPLTRPATTIAGRGLVPDPGSNANRFNGRKKSRNDGYRVTEAEAAVLQGFPVDYPWQGNQGSRFEQIGNAVPPPLAAALLKAVGA